MNTRQVLRLPSAGWWLPVLAMAAALCAGPAGAQPAAGEAVRGLAVTAQAAPADTAPAAAPSAPAAAPALAPILPFNEAVLSAAHSLFKSASEVVQGDVPLVIDPLIDGNTGVQSAATQTMQARVSELLRASYPRFQLQPFNVSSLMRAPLLFIGTFTAVDKDGRNAGTKEWYRVCLALLDVRSGKVVSKGFARSKPDGVDITPTQFFMDSPAWAPDAATDGYVRSCQGTKAGDAINPAYWDKIVAAAMINDAVAAYNAGRYDEAFDLYRGIARSAGGSQLRVYNGIYLTSWKLGRQEDAAQAFATIVDYGIQQRRLAVKFLFRPGTTQFINEPTVAAPYPIWLKQIASRTGAHSACLEVAGHTSRTGPEPLNERLSTMRAQFIKQRLEADVPALTKRVRAFGRGSTENISGLGTDDARDALDRRVEFKVVSCAGA